MMYVVRRYSRLALSLALWQAVSALPARADDNDGWVIRNKVDEEFRVREQVGISKDRTEAQSDLDKTIPGGVGMFSSLRLHTTLRASYDAVYDLNSSNFGEHAGTAVSFANNNGGVTAWGAAPTWQNLGGAGGGLSAGNTNSGLQMVDWWRGNDKGLQFATPVRPCDVDHRGCLKGYMDNNQQELASPEFDKRLDFLREFYVDGEIPVGDNTLALRLGRQQLVWGRTDLFRVNDVVNPVDYSRNNIYDELQDSRIPMGMLRADYRMGARGPFDDLNLQGIVGLEPFRPDNLGQGGSPNQPGGAASMFRALATCWQVGCTVGNYLSGKSALTFGPHEIGIRQADVPGWSLDNTTIGGKVEGELKGVGFSLNALRTISQTPVLKGGISSVNGLTGATGVWAYAPAFDVVFPHINVFGGSADYNIEPLNTTVRVESTYTTGELLTDDATSDLVKKSDVFRYVLGADRNTFIPFLNERQAFLISAQVFGKHIVNYDQQRTPAGDYMGMADWHDNWVTTLLIKGWYDSQTISPQIVFAHDVMANANAIEPSVEWIPTSAWRFRLGTNVKFGQDHQLYSTNADTVPWGGGPATNAWLSGQPFGDIRDGVIGQAHHETEVFANATLRF
jgi:hypothetical protein